MTRTLLAGTILNEIAGSLLRYPAFKVFAWNPIRNDIGQVATGHPVDAPLDLTSYVEQVDLEENIGYENPDNPSPTRATITFRKNLPVGKFRRGWLADGVIVRVLEGDRRVQDTEWTPVFTGHFRGRPGENKGSRSDLSEGLSANAYGREEQFMSAAPITTDSFPAGTDLGEIAYNIAWKKMGLSESEILFGAFGFTTLHTVNQIVDLPPLDALYHCMFPVGKKPKFDGLGRLCAVNIDLDKPAARIYTAGDHMIEKLIASPNDIEVNNQVIMRGQDHNKTKAVQDAQVIDTVDLTTGFFDARVKRATWFSPDHSQKAEDTFLVARHPIKWSKASWSQADEFHGEISIDTHFLRNVREIIFGSYLALQLAIVIIDFVFQAASAAAGTFLAILRAVLQVASQLALAALLWSMNYIGRGEYQVWGAPYEYVYQELVSDNRLTGLDPEELRAYAYTNQFISDMATLDAVGRERLRRELLKNQTYEIEHLFDPLLEVDDVIQAFDGSRYYITTVRKTMRRGAKASMTLTAWKVYEDILASARVVTTKALGYGTGYGEFYGEDL